MARVLIVDDSAVVRKGLREILTSLGYTVVGEAANGTQAFVEYAKFKPDVVTMDLTMEGMSGAEATSKIIATHAEARIVVISAMEEKPVIIDALERGARHFIIKPITKEKVEAVLSNVLQQKFDHQKHMELVRKLKGVSDEQNLRGPGYNSFEPPYQISVQDGKMVLVKISATFTGNSCRSLAMELEEHVKANVRMLFDFGETPKLEIVSLKVIDRIIEKIEAQSGMVKAATHNQEFFELVSNANETEKLGFLAANLRRI
jgi:YesN/AraC family two-component response regulator